MQPQKRKNFVSIMTLYLIYVTVILQIQMLGYIVGINMELRLNIGQIEIDNKIGFAKFKLWT